MWPPTMTPCECTEPGWCPRHQCRKPAEWHALCRLRLDYFEAWEKGRGLYLPGDQPSDSFRDRQQIEAEEAAALMADESSGPGLLQRAWNFSRAAVRHIADAGREVDECTREKRLAVCRDCPDCDTERFVCRHQSCGCFLNIKARWESEDCPAGKWLAIHSESETPSH